ncbi:MAG: hypothetical protein WC622_10130 [Pedobacter sp.]|jgi:hypothetical protein|uniref:hypothetical protein n=1 Tax=Pedobacter sp. TaxID=1411316 RepID=UPI0035691036
MKKYKLKLSTASLIAFISLRHFFHELHELMHMIVGRMYCGAWGTRDFNRVSPMPLGCKSEGLLQYLIGLEGPLFNFVMIWIGTILLKRSKSEQQASWGFALIFASLPIARLVTAIVGGGDELGVALHSISSPWIARVIIITLIFALIIYPIVLAYKTLDYRFKFLYILGFLFLPMILEGIVVLGFFNSLLAKGIYTEIWFMGMPKLVVITLAVDIFILLIFGKNIKFLLKAHK